MFRTNRFAGGALLASLVLLGACSQQEYELNEMKTEVTQDGESLQWALEYEIVNNSDEEYYLSLLLPPYIENALITNAGPLPVPPGTTIGRTAITVSKDGGEMTEETIDALLNGELPFVEEYIMGKVASEMD